MQLFCKVRDRKHFFRFTQQQLKKKKKKLYALWSRSKIHTFTMLNTLYTYFPHNINTAVTHLLEKIRLVIILNVTQLCQIIVENSMKAGKNSNIVRKTLIMLYYCSMTVISD